MSSAAGVAASERSSRQYDAERFILGSVLLDHTRFIEIAGVLNNDDFALEKHRRIFTRMNDLHARDEKIDRVTAGQRASEV